MVSRLVLCSLLVAPSAALQLAPLAARPALARPRATLRAQEGNRYSDPILDESLDDPVYDIDSKYLGKVNYGFSSAAEAANGRAAMMGFTICFFQETAFGKGALRSQPGMLPTGMDPDRSWHTGPFAAHAGPARTSLCKTDAPDARARIASPQVCSSCITCRTTRARSRSTSGSRRSSPARSRSSLLSLSSLAVPTV